MGNDKAFKLVALFFLFFILFNFPIVGLFSLDYLVAGVPPLFLFFFICWLSLVFILARTVERNPGD